MGNCCGNWCNCVVVAGDGATVEGNGSESAPYVISGPGAAGSIALQVTDTDTVDLALAGDGSAGAPYNVTAAVILDPAPPGSGDQLIQSGPDGLFLECEQVRGCLAAADGAGYDPGTGITSARLSTDAGTRQPHLQGPAAWPAVFG